MNEADNESFEFTGAFLNARSNPLSIFGTTFKI